MTWFDFANGCVLLGLMYWFGLRRERFWVIWCSFWIGRLVLVSLFDPKYPWAAIGG